MRHSHILSAKEMALVTLNGVARSHRNGGRGSHRAKAASTVAAWERNAKAFGASDEEITHARESRIRLRF